MYNLITPIKNKKMSFETLVHIVVSRLHSIQSERNYHLLGSFKSSAGTALNWVGALIRSTYNNKTLICHSPFHLHLVEQTWPVTFKLWGNPAETFVTQKDVLGNCNGNATRMRITKMTEYNKSFRCDGFLLTFTIQIVTSYIK